jgi:microcystin degradation protein MlrC
MRVFLGNLVHETNTFAPMPTGLADFESFELFRGNATAPGARAIYGQLLKRWRSLAERDGHEVVEGLCASAESSGRIVQRVYEGLRDELLDNLHAAGRVDVVLLNLHGAMSAYDCDDCEGDLLTRVRSLVGPACIVGVEVDLHCHLSAAMLEQSNLVIGYKEYPHTDPLDRAEDLYRLVIAAANGRVKPVSAVFDCRMTGYWHTTVEPMAGFVRRMQAVERERGILSVSLAHGYMWGDVADAGAKLWVVADGDRELAARWAETLGREFFALRHATRPTETPLEEALDAVAGERHDKPLVIGDIADNAGGGAPGDSTFILERLVERKITNVALGCIWDPLAASIAFQAGVGAAFRLRVGGKSSEYSGRPLDLDVTVRGVAAAHTQTGLLGHAEPFGTSAWLEAAGIDIVVTTLRNQVFSPDAFTGLGITLSGKAAVVVKSSQHFYAAFNPLASRVLYVPTPGGLRNAAELVLRKRPRPFWPEVEDPFA